VLESRRRPFDESRFVAAPIVGILRGLEGPAVIDAVEAASRGGLTTVEVTMNSPRAAETIQALVARYWSRLEIGAGTVLDLGDLDRAEAAGATFIVTPAVVPEVIREARARGLAVIAGALTPTEILTAASLGADFVKIFPASVFGPSYIREVRAPLGNVRFLPTGGISVESIPEYRRAGAVAFGVGSPLFRRERIEAGDFAFVEREAARFVAASTERLP
jgi:2-dehydro-3-deoxyphosphogluconate aldolase/(4S)-4-hydroxy-2-oxoglutarate aldolase